MKTVHTLVGTCPGHAPNLEHSTRIERLLMDLGYAGAHSGESDPKFYGWNKVYQGEIHHRLIYTRPRR